MFATFHATTFLVVGTSQQRQGMQGLRLLSKQKRARHDRIETKIVLVDGEELTQFMIDHDIGVTPMSSYEVKKLDSDYFSEE